MRFTKDLVQEAGLSREDLSCMTDTAYEVQVAALKSLTANLKSSKLDSAILSWAQDVAVSELMVAKNPKVLICMQHCEAHERLLTLTRI